MPLVREVAIENYKSIRKLTVELGQVNVLIGANGAGKSNLLEAIALGAASARNKLDNEYLVPRGIRVVEPRFTRSAFPGGDVDAPVVVSLQAQGGPKFRLAVDPERRSLISFEQGSLESNPIVFITGQVRAQLDKAIEQALQQLPEKPERG